MKNEKLRLTKDNLFAEEDVEYWKDKVILKSMNGTLPFVAFHFRQGRQISIFIHLVILSIFGVVLCILTAVRIAEFLQIWSLGGTESNYSISNLVLLLVNSLVLFNTIDMLTFQLADGANADMVLLLPCLFIVANFCVFLLFVLLTQWRILGFTFKWGK